MTDRADVAAYAGTIDGAVSVIGPVANLPPVADAGPDISRACDDQLVGRVVLSATASSDPHGDRLTATWTGPFGTIARSDLGSFWVTLPVGESEVTLEVSDGELSDFDSLLATITCTSEDRWAHMRGWLLQAGARLEREAFFAYLDLFDRARAFYDGGNLKAAEGIVSGMAQRIGGFVSSGDVHPVFAAQFFEQLDAFADAVF